MAIHLQIGQNGQFLGCSYLTILIKVRWGRNYLAYYYFRTPVCARGTYKFNFVYLTVCNNRIGSLLFFELGLNKHIKVMELNYFWEKFLLCLKWM